MKKIKATSLYIFLFIVFIPTINAQDTLLIPLDVLQREDVITGRPSTDVRIVSASRSSQNIADIPITVYVITKEEIRNNGYVTLADALKNAPGIRVSQPGSGFDGETFLMRGLLGNSYAKILLNNLPIQPSVTGSIAIGEQLPIAQAERIEIIYGASAAIYGADALAGVINIITEMPQEFTFAQATILNGEYGYRGGSFIAGGKAGKDKNIVEFTAYGSFSSREDMNIRHTKDPNLFNPLFYATQGDEEARAFAAQFPDVLFEAFKIDAPYYEGTAQQATIASLREESQLIGMVVRFRGLQVSFEEMYRRSPSALGRTVDIFSYASPDFFIGQNVRRTALSYGKAFSKSFLTLNASYMQYRMDSQSALGVNYTNLGEGKVYKFEASDDIFVEGLLNFPLSPSTELTVGASSQLSSNYPLTNDLEEPFDVSQYKPFMNNRPAPHYLYGDFGHNPITFRNLGAFFQFFYMKNRWSVMGGFRGDYSSLFGTLIFPRLAVLYKIGEKSAIRINLGSGVKNPNASSIYSSTAIPYSVDGITIDPDSVIYQQIPNTLLRSEILGSYELGFRTQLSPKIDLDVALYINRTNQQITNSLTVVSTETYPNAAYVPEASPAPDATFRIARSFLNDENSSGSLIGLQTNLRFHNIWESIKFDADIFYTFSTGMEELPEKRGIIDRYRMVPQHFLQCNFSFSPVQRLYMSFHHIISSNWLRRFVPVPETADLPEFTTRGYYQMDFNMRYQISEGFSGFVKVRNVFDTEYGGIDALGLDVDLLYNPQLKRNIQFGLSFRLN